ncbi:PAS domain-containing protein [Streptomyces fagopyri]|uniref:PAS domain-containing protein n=1 Tax=Streptomyces fagopyri TaxID=2662397 RepID=UPI0036A11223
MIGTGPAGHTDRHHQVGRSLSSPAPRTTPSRASNNERATASREGNPDDCAGRNRDTERLRAPRRGDGRHGPLDVHGGVQGWSGGAREILGYTPREVLGRPVSALLAAEGDILHDIRGCRTDRPWSGPVRLRHRDGHTVEVVLECQQFQGSTRRFAFDRRAPTRERTTRRSRPTPPVSAARW